MNELVQFGQNFDFKIRREHEKKKSHERRAYESVDDRSLSWTISRKCTKKNSRHKGLKNFFKSNFYNPL